jgi:phospholipid/cholesterol/gamma-HCH transport system substrate-binding protein
VNGVERLYTPPQVGAPGRAAARRRRRELRRTGLFVVGMGLLLALVMSLLHYRSLSAIHIDTYLPFTAGLSPGAVVKQAGYSIGSVTSVAPVFGAERRQIENLGQGCLDSRNRPCFRIRLRLRSDWNIPDDSQAVIGSSVLQGAVVRIEPGTSATFLDDGATVAGHGEGSDLEQLQAKIAQILDGVTQAMDQTIRPLLASIEGQMRGLQDLMIGSAPAAGQHPDSGDTGDTGTDAPGGGPALPTAAGNALTDASEVLANLRQLTADLAGRADQARDTDIGKLLRATRKAAENVETITADINARSAEIRKAVAQFSQLGEELNELVQNAGPNVQATLTDSQYMIQEIATALTPILNTVDETTRNLLELSRDLRDNPGVLLGGRNTRDNAPDNYR